MAYEILSNRSKYVVDCNLTVTSALQHARENNLSTMIITDTDQEYFGCIETSTLKFMEHNSGTIGQYADKRFYTINKEHNGPILRGLTPVIDGNKLHSVLVLPTQGQLERARQNLHTVVIVGMGFVGATLAIALAESGLHVIGVEKNPDVRDSLKQGILQFHEPGAHSRLQSVISDGRLQIVSSTEYCSADAYIITVGTPLIGNGNNKPNREYLYQALSYVEHSCKGGEVVILRSTVPVGTCDDIITKYKHLFVASDEEKNLTLAMAPERTIEGRALEELSTNPQIIGSSSAIGFIKAEKIFKQLGAKIVRLKSYKEAELAKLVDNSFRDFWFSYSNALAVIGDGLGVDVLDVINAVNYEYERTNVAFPSPGVGGPCLSKDPYILIDSLSNKYPSVEKLIRSSREINELVLTTFVGSLVENIGDTMGEIHVLGMAFKGCPETDDLRDSTSLAAIAQLKELGQKFRIWDPVIDKETLKAYGDTVDEERIGQDASGIIILNNHRYYAQLNWPKIAARMKKTIIYDGWNVLKGSQTCDFETVKILGK